MDLEANVKPIVFQDEFDLGTVTVSTRAGSSSSPIWTSKADPKRKKKPVNSKIRKGKKKAETLIVGIILAQYRKTGKSDHLR